MSLKRKITNVILKAIVYLSSSFTVLMLIGIIGYIFYKGIPVISWEFLTTSESFIYDTFGILPNILNTFYVILLTLVIVLPLGIGAAVYLNEYATSKRLVSTVETAVETLAAIPSIIYGLVGMLFFRELLGFGMSLTSGCLTLVVMILPTIVRTTQESLRTVPQSYREGAIGLGSTKWHSIRTIILPNSLDGIVTGCILSIGRIVGESAALLYTAGLTAGVVTNIFEAYSKAGGTLSVALYLYVNERGNFDAGFGIAAVLMFIVLVINMFTKMTQRLLKKRKDK
ncbi:MAG: phosphate ABC transporter permease PstA [Clostridia bacterium]